MYIVNRSAEAAGDTLDITVNFTCSPVMGTATPSSDAVVDRLHSTTILNNTNLPRGDIGPLDFSLPAGVSDAEGVAACNQFCKTTCSMFIKLQAHSHCPNREHLNPLQARIIPAPVTPGCLFATHNTVVLSKGETSANLNLVGHVA